MTQIDKIRQEIERLKRHYQEGVQEFGRIGYKDNVLLEQAKETACDTILSFIESLEQEPTCKDSLHVEQTCEDNSDSFTNAPKIKGGEK